MTRCIHIDWLEVHVLEDMNLFPCDKYFFVREGWRVEQREYGTRVYEQMFTLFDQHDEPFLEVRRAPKSSSDSRGVLVPNSCHIRLTNRYCYFPNAVALLRDFLARYNYTFRRIFRIDICNDFVRFDLGDDPAKFVQRYLTHKYAKINQCNRTTRGEDRWDGCEDNYVSWGAPTSVVSTKLYNKSKELAEARDKPYIRQSWMAAGLITNPITMVKVRPDGTQYTPTIWRVEFSVRSGSQGWAKVEDCNGANNRKKYIDNTLQCYDTDEKLLLMFASLAHHYFHFKYYEHGQRKDRCRDKVLFHFDFAKDKLVKLARISQSKPQPAEDLRLRKALELYKISHFEPSVQEACKVLLDNIHHGAVARLASERWDIKQVQELRELLKRRMRHPDEDFAVALDAVRRLIQGDKIPDFF